MGFDVTAMLDYVRHDEQIANRVVAGAKTIDFLQSYGSLVFGKGEVALSNISQTIVFGDGSTCGRVEGGTTELDQRKIKFHPITEYTSFCMKDLYAKFLNEKISKGQKEEKLDNEIYGKIVEGRADMIAGELEKLIWQGDVSLTGTTNMKRFDGFVKVITADGETLTVTGADVIAKLQSFVGQIPTELKAADDFRVFIGKHTEDAINLKLFQLNLFNPAQAGTIPGTTVKYEVMPGLNGVAKVVGARATNLRAILDDAADANTAEGYYVAKDKKVYLDFAFGSGVQITIADETYIATV